MELLETGIRGLVLIKPRVFGDERGFFFESYQEKRYREAKLVGKFVQDNLSVSAAGVLRGLHIQNPHGQAKLVQVLSGRAFDVAVDVRRGSPTFGKYFTTELSATNHWQLYIPPGFAHGFLALEEQTMFQYKCTEVYHPEFEFAIAWDDKEIRIPWPTNSPSLSPKDTKALSLGEALESGRLPKYEQA